MCAIKVTHSPVLLRSTNLESKLIKLFVFVKILAYIPFWESQTVHCRKIGDFQSALTSNNQFIIKLVKMWPGGTLHVVVGTLKISLDRLKKKA